eukprot:1160450-Pelagomonas_calceolata.AAC.10
MDVEQASKELAVHVSKWEQLHEFESSKDSWLGAPCQDLNAEEIQEKVGPPCCYHYQDALMIQILLVKACKGGIYE